MHASDMTFFVDISPAGFNRRKTLLCLLFLIAMTSFSVFCQDSVKRSDTPSTNPVTVSNGAGKEEPAGMKDAEISVAGIIKTISHVISPETAEYDDCNFTLLLEAEGENQEYFVVVPMFEKRVLSPFAHQKAGDRISLRMIPYQMTPEAVQEIQMIDDINDFGKQMFYSAALTEDDAKGALVIDPGKKNTWLKKLLRETALQLSGYYDKIAENMEERDAEISEFKNVTFKAVQKPYGYFAVTNFFVQTTHYNPTLLQGLVDLSERCKFFGCELVVVPGISMQEYSEKELLSTFNDVPFIDCGREKLVFDCLKKGILALDTNLIIHNHQTAEYLPYSLLGDNHFSTITNLYIADEIATNLDIKKNSFNLNKSYFYISTQHLPYYSGPTRAVTEPVFEKTSDSFSADEPSVLVAGDSFTTTNNFNGMMSSLAQCNVAAVRRDAGPNTALYELLEGRYDSVLQKASLLVFIFCSPYMTTNYATKELVDITARIRNGEVASYNIPVGENAKSVTVSSPGDIPEIKPLKAVVDVTPFMAVYTMKINNRAVFDYDCVFPFGGGGDNRFVVEIEPEDFADGKVELSIDGNASFKKLILVDHSENK